MSNTCGVDTQQGLSSALMAPITSDCINGPHHLDERDATEEASALPLVAAPSADAGRAVEGDGAEGPGQTTRPRVGCAVSHPGTPKSAHASSGVGLLAARGGRCGRCGRCLQPGELYALGLIPLLQLGTRLATLSSSASAYSCSRDHIQMHCSCKPCRCTTRLWPAGRKTQTRSCLCPLTQHAGERERERERVRMAVLTAAAGFIHRGCSCRR